MEAQYHQFPPESEVNTTTYLQKGKKNIVVYVLYAVLLLLLFILLVVTGVKFSQLSKDVNEIKAQLAKPNRQQVSSPARSEAQTEHDVPRVLLTRITPVRGKCREGWTFYENSCYFLSTTKDTWSAAETQCQNLQGHLVVFNNVDELDYVSKIADLKESFWIGLVERHNEGHWSWVDGSDYNSIQTFWDRGQPDDWDYTEHGEDCGQIHAASVLKRRLWNDAECSFKFRYICESKI